MLQRRLLGRLDVPTLATALTLAIIGIVAIASATFDQPGRTHLWRAQLVALGFAAVAAAVVATVDYHVWAQFAWVWHSVALVLLVGVIFFGKQVAGNKSWLALGPVSLQPSELAKVTTCLVLAQYMSERIRGSVTFLQGVTMGVLVLLPMGLVAIQPDTGTVLTFVPIYAAALLLSGLRWRWVIAAMIVGALLAPVGWHHLKEYQRQRILNVLDPERDPSGTGYQVRQSKIAIGSGGFAGKGLFQGTQSRLNFLPAQHTDFVLAVISEEFGFVGAGAVLGLFYFLLYRGVLAARSSQDRLGTYLALLVVSWFTGQIAINVGMVLGLVPTIGVPLPFLSYGGTALLAVTAGAALVANIRSRRFVN